MLRDSKGLKITLLVIVVVAMCINFIPFDTYPGTQKVSAVIKDGATISIKSVAGDMTILVDPAATEITAQYTVSGRIRSKLSIEQNASSVVISEKFSQAGFLGFLDFTTRSTPMMFVTIPQEVAINAFSASSVSGDISVESNLQAQSIKLSSTSGELNFLDLVASNSIQLSTVSGEIQGYATNAANNVKVSSTSGNIDIYSMAAKDLLLNTVSGEIYGSMSIGSGNAKLSTVSGNIDIQLDANTNAVINLKSVTGDLILQDSSSQPYSKSANATIGSGSGTITASTTSGDISITW